MRIAVASSFVPFAPDPRDATIRDLLAALAEAGHATEHIRLPVPLAGPEALLAIRLLDLDAVPGQGIDRLLALDFPAVALRHPAKVAWVLPGAPVPPGADDLCRHAERLGYAEAHAVFPATTAEGSRLRGVCGVETGPPLLPPLRETEHLRGEAIGDHFVCLSGAELARRALAEAPVPLRLYAPDRDNPERTALLTAARGVLVLGDDLRGAQEAMRAGKPVVALRDSSVGQDLLRDGDTGYLVGPGPREIADAMERLLHHPARAAELGERARQSLARHPLGWAAVVGRLAA